MSDLANDIKAWRSLSRRHMPDWEPTLAGLLRLDEGPQELLVALRSIARGWKRDDARWDVLQAVVEFYKRQHAHELAEKIRAAEWAEPCSEGCCNGDGPEAIADFIDPKVG